MQNRFIEMKRYLQELQQQRSMSQSGYEIATSLTPPRQRSMQNRLSLSASRTARRVLVVLIENGGIDLGIPDLVRRLLDPLPMSSLISQSARDEFIRTLGSLIREVTDDVAENIELSVNRYAGAKPQYYGDVVILRNGTAFYNNLRDTLVGLSSDENKVIDLMVLTHGSNNYIALSGGTPVTSESIRELRTIHNGSAPLRLRMVYMMNCVGSSLNQAWLDVGAKASAGTFRNNYLPEPTTFFFFRNWKADHSFNDSVINAYRSSIESIKALIRTAANRITGLPAGIASEIVERLADIESRDFVRDSAPVIGGDGNVTINSDSLSFGSSVHGTSFAIVPIALSGALDTPGPSSRIPEPRDTSWTVSTQAVEFIKSFEGFRDRLYNDPAGHCTIGYGTLVHRGNCNGADSETPYLNGVTETRATELLRQRVVEFEAQVNNLVTVKLNRHQFDALVSFCYNVGIGAFRESTLLRKLNEGDYHAVPTELRRWTRANGRELPGLVRRREAEGRIFSSGDYSTGQSVHRSNAFQNQPRGIRNNNPGNLRISSQAWEGKIPREQNTDGAFEQFTSYAHGVRALALLIRNYITRGQPTRNTVRRVITAYAPASDNNHTEEYIRFVVNRLSDNGMAVDADTQLQADRRTLRLLVQSIARMENGVEAITDEQFDAGFALLPQDVRNSIGQSLARRYDRSQSFNNDSYAGFGEGSEHDSADVATEEGELEDIGIATPMTTAISAHCPANEADDASTAHFQLREFHSRDGVEVPRALRGNIQTLMEQLEVLRSEVSAPITISSGFRSVAHNTAVGGAPQSQHLCGRAADIKVSGMSPPAVHAKIEELIAAGRMIQGGLGLYRTFVHYDTRGTRARW